MKLLIILLTLSAVPAEAFYVGQRVKAKSCRNSVMQRERCIHPINTEYCYYMPVNGCGGSGTIIELDGKKIIVTMDYGMDEEFTENQLDRK